MDNIALFDMDGTIADYDYAMFRDLEPLYSPDEEKLTTLWDAPEYLENRMDMIKNVPGWWRGLPPIESGIRLLKDAQKIGYEVHILTQGPRNRPHAWKEKIEWVRDYLGDVDITITRNKGLVYGKVLVDDYPDYMRKWLKWRHRGLGIMPERDGNESYTDERVIKLSEETYDQAVEALCVAYRRNDE